MLQAIRIMITMTLLMGALLAPALGLIASGVEGQDSPALFITGMAMMTPTI